MKKSLLLAICLLGIGLSAISVSATVIASYTYALNDYQSVSLTPPAATVSMSPGFRGPRVFLFDGADTDHYDATTGIDLLGNVGKTFWESSNLDDPEYSQFVSELTDNENEICQLWVVDPTGAIGEAVPLGQLLGYPENWYSADLSNYHVDRIGLTIDSTTQSISNDPYFHYSYDFAVTYTIEGTSPVPEPKPILVFLLGFLGLFTIVYLSRVKFCSSVRLI